MKLKKKTEKLSHLYRQFEQDAAEFKKHAACKLGCTFCCTQMGTVDITTLEGLIIRNHLKSLRKRLQLHILDNLARDREEKQRGRKPPCPFLNQEGACLIYDIRPFSCRQLYSIRKCEDNGPMVHRQFQEQVRKTIREIQHLDNTGYSGHHTYILHLLEGPEFRKLYTSGGFDPGMIMEYGKHHGITINRWIR